jgi:stage V sporulation protein SpoVS
LCRSADFLHHLLGGNYILAGKVTAFLRKRLVLDLDAGGAGALQGANRAHDIDRVAIAGVGIDDDRD